ncbi:Cupin-2 domain-containing protein [Mycena venus]|uniref:Cupin-2 domain-containing protein n=1 Tax=Mycena venus TaxID=2733690 RepID=A0A8H6XAR7_9AGAR|nr:Cupin-2 domain-containing protein [Mycena venus]
MASADSTQLPDARLVVTGHTPDGTSVFTFDDIRKPFMPFRATGRTLHELPCESQSPGVKHRALPRALDEPPRCPPEGVIFCIADIPPGGSGAPMHRTQSVDYVVVLFGEIVLALDNGRGEDCEGGRVHRPARDESRVA